MMDKIESNIEQKGENDGTSRVHVQSRSNPVVLNGGELAQLPWFGPLK